MLCVAPAITLLISYYRTVQAQVRMTVSTLADQVLRVLEPTPTLAKIKEISFLLLHLLTTIYLNPHDILQDEQSNPRSTT